MQINVITKKIKTWVSDNRLTLIYALLASLFELVAVSVVEGSFFLSRPFLSIGILLFAVGLALMIKGERVRFLVCCLFLLIQCVCDILLVLVYDMTGQYFYYEMLNLRNDAVAALDSFPIDFIVFYTGIFVCATYAVYGIRYLKSKTEKTEEGKSSFWYKITLFVVGICTIGTSVASYYPHSLEDRYKQMVSGNAQGLYASYGLIGNLVGEFGSKLWEDKKTPDDETIKNFIYAPDSCSSPTNYFGIAKDKNVVVILAESFEWYAFMNGAPYYNALPFTDEELAYLYPNLTRFYNESVRASNYHSREKTDLAETLSVMGCYPLDGYVTYDYPEVSMPMSLPNVLGTLYPDMQKRSFHNGDKEFYNRLITHKSFGFDEEMMDKVDMAKLAKENLKEGETPTFTDYDVVGDNRQYNLDSEMIETCKDIMFPKDKRFFTYITTITMHGTYTERENLKEHHEKINTLLGERMPTEKEDEKLSLLHYMTSAMEFDKAIGAIFADLEKKELLDDTLIYMFGDHNAYFESMSNYVKDIDSFKDDDRKYTELYRVPMMIYDTDLTAKIPKEKRTIDKFVCTADIVPTLFDLLGIRYYGNIYYGNSIFSKKQSVLYSRGYDVFVSDGIVARSVENLVYRYEDVTKGQEDEFKKAGADLVEKMKYTDYIFIKDWFKKPENIKEFKSKMQELQGAE